MADYISGHSDNDFSFLQLSNDVKCLIQLPLDLTDLILLSFFKVDASFDPILHKRLN